MRNAAHLRDLSRTPPSLRAVTFVMSTDPIAGTAALDEASVREYNAVIALLESLAVRLSPPFDAQRRAALRAANARLRAASDPVAAAIADRDVHRRLIEPGADAILLDTLRPAQTALRPLAADGHAGDARRHAAEHDEIIDALAAGDIAAAADRLREHVTGRLQPLLDAVGTRTGRSAAST
jgi:DNA-binding GntR family transcriptional regulator